MSLPTKFNFCMKNATLLLICLLTAVFAFGQAPQEINYQGVARNMKGSLLSNQAISLRLSIHDGSINGPVVYQETRALRTNGFGLFTVGIGSGGATGVTGSLSTVNWGSGGGKYLQIEMDPEGRNNFIHMGTSQLLSVPYAFYAGKAQPFGAAGGGLAGSYPNPVIANGAVGTAAVQDGAITASKLAPGILLNGSDGPAGGDLSGVYPNPLVNNNAITSSKLADNAVVTAKIADASVTAAKLAPGVIPTSIPVSGTAGGDLAGTFPNPAVSKIQGVAVSSTLPATGQVLQYDGTKWSPVLMSSGGSTPTGPAGGDLNGAYPNPNIAPNTITSNKLAPDAVTTQKINDGAVTTAKLADGSVTAAKLAPGVIPTSIPVSGTAGGALSGTYPNPDLANGAVGTAAIADGSVTAAKLATGVIPTSLPPSGSAGGALSGTYPNPALANSAVGTAAIADGSVTAAKLAPGVIPTSLPVSGTAGGDLTGTYPNPAVNKIQGVTISGTAPASGQVLQFNGTQWTPATISGGGSFTLPFSASNTSTNSLFSITNSNTGGGLQGINSSANANAVAVEGKITNAAPGTAAAAIRGSVQGTNGEGMGVWGSHAGGGAGVFGSSVSGYGLSGQSQNGAGVFGTSITGNGGFFDISSTTNYSDAVFANTVGVGNGVTGISDKYVGIQGITNDVSGVGVLGFNNAGGEAIHGITLSTVAAAVVGQNYAANAGVSGISVAGGTGVLAQVDAGNPASNAVVGELMGAGAGNTALFKSNNTNVARIDNTGKAFFNGGTQTGGADVAEYFDVEGSRSHYEPGDVLVISQTSDRSVEKSSGAYSTLVAGVFATKPGVLLTEHNAEQDMLQAGVPMGVIGVIPTKVCTEGGAIKRGDMLVTSSLPGIAMKADPDKVKPGQVLGKALQDYNGNGTGKIIVLVCVK